MSKLTAPLTVLRYPHPSLREIALPVSTFDDALRHTVAQMFATLYQLQYTVGLAATQVGIPFRVIVMDTSEHRDEAICLINPEVIASEGSVISNEGCASFQKVYAKVARQRQVTVKYRDEFENSHTLTTEGLAAICIQHEIDHLNGILFIDHLSKLKRTLLLKKLEKQMRLASESE